MDIDKIIYISLPKKKGHTNISDKTETLLYHYFGKSRSQEKLIRKIGSNF